MVTASELYEELPLKEIGGFVKRNAARIGLAGLFTLIPGFADSSPQHENPKEPKIVKREAEKELVISALGKEERKIEKNYPGRLAIEGEPATEKGVKEIYLIHAATNHHVVLGGRDSGLDILKDKIRSFRQYPNGEEEVEGGFASPFIHWGPLKPAMKKAEEKIKGIFDEPTLTLIRGFLGNYGSDWIKDKFNEMVILYTPMSEGSNLTSQYVVYRVPVMFHKNGNYRLHASEFTIRAVSTLREVEFDVGVGKEFRPKEAEQPKPDDVEEDQPGPEKVDKDGAKFEPDFSSPIGTFKTMLHALRTKNSELYFECFDEEWINSFIPNEEAKREFWESKSSEMEIFTYPSRPIVVDMFKPSESGALLDVKDSNFHFLREWRNSRYQLSFSFEKKDGKWKKSKSSLDGSLAQSGIQIESAITESERKFGKLAKIDEDGWIHPDDVNETSEYDFSNVNHALLALLEAINNQDTDLISDLVYFYNKRVSYLGFQKKLSEIKGKYLGQTKRFRLLKSVSEDEIETNYKERMQSFFDWVSEKEKDGEKNFLEIPRYKPTTAVRVTKHDISRYSKEVEELFDIYENPVSVNSKIWSIRDVCEFSLRDKYRIKGKSEDDIKKEVLKLVRKKLSSISRPPTHHLGRDLIGFCVQNGADNHEKLMDELGIDVFAKQYFDYLRAGMKKIGPVVDIYLSTPEIDPLRIRVMGIDLHDFGIPGYEPFPKHYSFKNIFPGKKFEAVKIDGKWKFGFNFCY